MARDVYFRDDILNVLRSAEQASDGMAVFVDEFGGVPGDVVLAAYRRGFVQALVTVGLAFGLEVKGESDGKAEDFIDDWRGGRARNTRQDPG